MRHIKSYKLFESTLSDETIKAVERWINDSSRFKKMERHIIKELDSNPTLKPKSPVTLYRGLLWDGEQMKPGNTGDRFKRTIKNGVAEYESDRVDSWSSDRDMAGTFAVSLPSDDPNTDKFVDSEIDGKFGVIISTVVEPKNIIADLSKVTDKRTVHSDESEYLIRPGRYNVSVIEMYDENGKIQKVQELSEKFRVDGQSYETFSITGLTKLMANENGILGRNDRFISWDQLFDVYESVNGKRPK